MPKLPNILAFVLSVVCVTGLSLARAGDAVLTIIPASERKPAPTFTLANLQGQLVSLADFRGRIVLLNFWATWCMPCRQEMPGIETVWQAYQAQGFTVLAVSIDEVAPARIARFVDKLQLSFPVLHDAMDQVGSQYRVSGLPVSFLIDREGRIASEIVGSREWSSTESETVLKQLLAQ